VIKKVAKPARKRYGPLCRFDSLEIGTSFIVPSYVQPRWLMVKLPEVVPVDETVTQNALCIPSDKYPAYLLAVSGHVMVRPLI